MGNILKFDKNITIPLWVVSILITAICTAITTAYIMGKSVEAQQRQIKQNSEAIERLVDQLSSLDTTLRCVEAQTIATNTSVQEMRHILNKYLDSLIKSNPNISYRDRESYAHQ